MSGLHHLAQLNTARPRGPLDGPLLAELMADLDRIDGLGDARPGLVRRDIASLRACARASHPDGPPARRADRDAA